MVAQGIMSDWESYWKGVRKTGNKGDVFWDAEGEGASRKDLERFSAFFEPALPLLDLGCGNGRQTRFLARHYPRVIGADVSEAAVTLARRETGDQDGIEFRVLDALRTSEARAFHREFGDVNLYMRGVLHMIKWHDRPCFIKNLAIMLGQRGTLYQIELSSTAILELRALPDTVFANIPKVTRRVGFNLEDRETFYPDADWLILDEGDGADFPSIPLPNGEKANLPGNYLIVRPRRADPAA